MVSEEWERRERTRGRRERTEGRREGRMAWSIVEFVLWIY